MKICIEHNGIKRLIEGTGFNICASAEDLKTIADAIADRLSENPGYGWLKIRDPLPDEHCAPDTKPIPWISEKR